MAAAQDLSEWDNDPRLFLFTSLTSGSSQIFTATSRMELILKGNKIPFLAIDVATDEKARKLWGRRAGKRRLPGLVKEDMVIGDFNEVEEWNEFGELKEVIGPVPAAGAAVAPAKAATPAAAAPSAATTPSQPAAASSNDETMRNLAAEAAGIALASKKGPSPGVNESKIRSLDGFVPGTPPSEPQQEKTTFTGIGGNEAASSSSIAVTEPPQSMGLTEGSLTSPEMTATKAASVGLSEFQPRDPTDAVPSAGTPLVPVAALASPKSTPSPAATGLSEFQPRDPTDAVPSIGSPLPPAAASSPRSTPSSSAPLDSKAGLTSSDSLAGGAGLAESASDLALADNKTALESTASLEPAALQPAGSRRESHRGSDVREASTDDIKHVENAQRIDEADEDAHEAAAAVDEAPKSEVAPAAADAAKAGESVQD